MRLTGAYWVELKKVAICLLVFATTSGIGAAGAAEKLSFVDPSLLNAPTRELYHRVVRTLDTWNGDPDWLTDAEEIINQVATKEPRFLPIAAERARLTIMKSNFSKQNAKSLVATALEMLASINKSDPRYARAYVLAGHANIVLGRFDAAKVALDRATALKSDDPWLQYNYSDFYGQTGRYDKAVSYAVSAILAGIGNERVLAGALYQLHTFVPRLESASAVSEIGKTLFNGIKDEGRRMALVGALIKGAGRSPVILGSAQVMLDLQRERTKDLPDLNVLAAQLTLETGMRFLREGIPRFDPASVTKAKQLLASVSPTSRTQDRIFDLNTTIAFSLEDLAGANQLIANAGGVSKNLVDEKRATWQFLVGDYVAASDLMQDLVLRDRKYSNHPVLLMSQTVLGKSEKYIATAKNAMELANYTAQSMGSYSAILLYTADDLDGAIDYGEQAIRKSSYGVVRATTSLAHLVKAARLREAGDMVQSKIHLSRAEEIGFDEEYLLRSCRRHCADLRSALKLRAPG